MTDEARNKLINAKKYPLEIVLKSFTTCVTAEEWKKIKVWGNSNRFDCGLLHNAYTACEMDIPWEFRNERDCRTLVDYGQDIKEKEINIGIQHNGVDDCIYQIGYVSKIHRRLNGKN